MNKVGKVGGSVQSTTGRINGIAFIPAELDDYGLDVYEFRVYCRMVRRANGGISTHTQSQPNVARELGISERKVRTAMLKLETFGLVRKEFRSGRTNAYQLTPVSEWAIRPSNTTVQGAGVALEQQGTPAGDAGHPGMWCRGTPARGADKGTSVKVRPEGITEETALPSSTGTATATDGARTATPKETDSRRKTEPARATATEGEDHLAFKAVTVADGTTETEAPPVPPGPPAATENPLHAVDVMALLGIDSEPAGGTARNDWNLASGRGSAKWRAALDVLHEKGISGDELRRALWAYRAAMEGKSAPQVVGGCWLGKVQGKWVPNAGPGLMSLVKPDKMARFLDDPTAAYFEPHVFTPAKTLSDVCFEDDCAQAKAAGLPIPTRESFDARVAAAEQKQREREAMPAEQRNTLIAAAEAVVLELLGNGPVAFDAFNEATTAAGLDYRDVRDARDRLGVETLFTDVLRYGLPRAEKAAA
jgi:hypothetical protein